MPEKNITFEIREHIGVITSFDSGWNRELNIISWNGNAPKYDIRDWDPHHERMKKGITFHEAEMRRMVELYLNNNSRKAVEAGRALEAERRQRRQDQIDARTAGNEGSGNYFEAAADADAFEGARPPAEEPPEGAELEPAAAEEGGQPENAAPSEKPDEAEETVPQAVGEEPPF